MSVDPNLHGAHYNLPHSSTQKRTTWSASLCSKNRRSVLKSRSRRVPQELQRSHVQPSYVLCPVSRQNPCTNCTMKGCVIYLSMSTKWTIDSPHDIRYHYANTMVSLCVFSPHLVHWIKTHHSSLLNARGSVRHPPPPLTVLFFELFDWLLFGPVGNLLLIQGKLLRISNLLFRLRYPPKTLFCPTTPYRSSVTQTSHAWKFCSWQGFWV